MGMLLLFLKKEGSTLTLNLGAIMRRATFFIRFVDNLNHWQGKIVSFFIYPIMLILVYEVVMRYVFASPTIWAHETSCFLYGAHFILGGAYALRWRAFVKIEILYERFPLRTRAIVDLFTWILFYIFCGVLLWKSAPWAWASVRVLEYSQSTWGPPIWPIKLTIPLAAVLILLQGLTKTTKDFYTAITGREAIIAGIGTKVADSKVIS